VVDTAIWFDSYGEVQRCEAGGSEWERSEENYFYLRTTRLLLMFVTLYFADIIANKIRLFRIMFEPLRCVYYSCILLYSPLYAAPTLTRIHLSKL
jgi:hypothetical protein